MTKWNLSWILWISRYLNVNHIFLNSFQTDLDFLIVPFSEAVANKSDKREALNCKVRRGRVPIENDIGQIKAEYSPLQKGITVKDINMAGNLIKVLAAVHNFVKMHTTPREYKIMVLTSLLEILSCIYTSLLKILVDFWRVDLKRQICNWKKNHVFLK